MYKQPTLYKYAKSGAIQAWRIEAGKRFDDTAFYTTFYGQVDGAEQLTTVDVKVGKNLGKSNETTPYEQACSEAQSKWKGQLDKGYAQGKPAPLPTTSPMLAKSYEKEAAKVTFPCYWQPKLDGIRCVAKRQGNHIIMLRRKGKVFDSLGHIVKVLLKLMKDGDIFDGELYVHGEPFQRIISWVKREQADTLKVVYNVYDMISSEPFHKRFRTLCSRIDHNGLGVVRTVYTASIKNDKEVSKVLDDQLARGFEGIMLRCGGCKYQIGRRSSQLLKVKKFIENEYTIVDVVEGKGRAKGHGIFVCVTNANKRFNVMPEGTSEKRSEYWTNRAKYLGEELTVKYFELTKDGIPRFPVGKTIRRLVEG